MNALPHRTRMEKNIVTAAAIAILILLGVLMTMIVRLWLARRKRANEWKQRSAQQPTDSSENIH